MSLAPVTIAIHTFGEDARERLVTDVRAGLTSVPKTLPSRWFYDELGSRLFEAITELPEYYLTRAESSILDRVADQVVGRFSPESMVEIGAGSCTKTRVLIEAAMKRRLSCFVPFDISEAALQATARRLATDFPGLTVYAM